MPLNFLILCEEARGEEQNAEEEEEERRTELCKDRIKDLKDPLFLLFWSGQKDLHI